MNVWREPRRVEATVCIDDGGALIIDLLHPHYLRHTAAGLPYEDFFNAFCVQINDNLATMPLGSPQRSKWEWMAGFFNGALQRHQMSVQPFTSLPMP